MNTYEPIGNTALVEPLSPTTTLQLPGTYEADQYVIIALGDGDKVPSSISEDDIVILTPGAAMVKIPDTHYSIVNVDNIIARVNVED
jgi:co-chaperonin GroES (HSP10)